MPYYVVSSGVISTGISLNNDIMYVSSGGTANSTTVNSDGYLNVYSGGTANSTNVNSDGYLNVYSGGTATNIIWTPCVGKVYIENGAYVTYASQYSGVYYGSGNQLLSHAAVMNDQTVSNSGCSMYVMSGGTANSTTMSGGYMYVSSGGTANSTMVNDWGNLYISSGVANSTTVNSGGHLCVCSGGTASSTMVNSGGYMYVSSGGTANSATVNSGASLYVSSSGTATDIVWTPCEGHVYVYNGGYATFVSQYSGVYYGSDNQLLSNAAVMNDMTIGSACEMNVMNSGTANSTTMSGGYMYVSSGGTANDTTVNNGSLYVSSGGTANSTMVNKWGWLVVSSGGTAINIRENGGYVTIQDGANVTFVSNSFSGLILSGWFESATIHSGTTANNTTVHSCSCLHIYSGGIANDTTIIYDTYRSNPNPLTEVVVFSGGTANGITVFDGTLIVSSGGTAINIRENGGYVTIQDGANVTFVSNSFSGLTLGWYGSAMIHSGTTANSTTINGNRAYLIVSSGGIANTTTINSGGNLIVSSGGITNDTTVNNSGMLIVSSGGTATQIIENGGYVDVKEGANVTFVSNSFSGLTLSGWYGSATIHSGTTANSTTVNSTGNLEVSSGGTANSTTVYSGGELIVYSGGKLTGQTMIESGAVVSAFSGAILDFNISELVPGTAARINDFSLVSGWSDALYTLTVDGSQAYGEYMLAEGASDFNKKISVLNTSGDEFGTLKVGKKVTVGDTGYTLNLTGDALTVTVQSVEPIPDFYMGDFAGNQKSMLAVEQEQVALIYNDGAIWGGLTLDDGWSIAGVGDFNGDGADDILRVHTSGLVMGELSNGNGTFSPKVLNFKQAGWDILGTGDFNGNGTDDVLIANPTGASETVGLLGYWESGATWTLINGYSAEWECIATGDFDGDGKCDMLWRNRFEGEGGGTYNAYCTWIVDDPVDWRMVSVANPDEWNFLCSGDFDGDKMNDIAMINDVGVVGIWGINDGYLSSWSILSAVTFEWQLAGVADFNGDGTDDIAWCNTTDGQVGAWLVKDKTLDDWQIMAKLA